MHVHHWNGCLTLAVEIPVRKYLADHLPNSLSGLVSVLRISKHSFKHDSPCEASIFNSILERWSKTDFLMALVIAGTASCLLKIFSPVDLHYFPTWQKLCFSEQIGYIFVQQINQSGEKRYFTFPWLILDVSTWHLARKKLFTIMSENFQTS